MSTSSTTENKERRTTGNAKKESIKKSSVFFGTWKCFILLLIALVIVVTINILSKRIGMNIGKEAGIAAGRLKGSFDGITDGVAEGKKEGKEEGLSAKDTKTDIGNQIQAIGKLEVLSASVTVHDFMGISKDYGTIFALYGDIIFTVDLNKAQITKEGNRVSVILPKPEPDSNFNETKTEQLAVDMKHNWTGNNKDAYIATMNSLTNIPEQLKQSVANYDELMYSAEQSAIKQVSFLIKSASGEEVNLNVEFQKDEQQDT